MMPAYDHFVFTAPSLDVGCDYVVERLGVRPVAGGQHPNWGTHNALLSLGKTAYFEVLSPDPRLPRPERGRWMGAFFNGPPRLATWVIRPEDLERSWEKARSRGVALGDIEGGSRKREDGSVLSWRLTDPYALPLDGCVPFLIDWGETPHPGSYLPVAGSVEKIEIYHPHPETVREQLGVLELDMSVEYGEEVRLALTIRRPDGILVEL